MVLGGLVFVGVGLWNVRKAVTQSFSDDLDMGRIDLARRPTVCRFGTVGYLARGAPFALIGWFLFNAGRQHDASEGRGLDDAPRSSPPPRSAPGCSAPWRSAWSRSVPSASSTGCSADPARSPTPEHEAASSPIGRLAGWPTGPGG